MKRLQMSGVTLVVVLLGWISNAHATCILYTDQSAWQADVSGGGYNSTIIDFEQATVSSDHLSVTAGAVTFSSLFLPLEVTSHYGIPYGAGKVLYPTHNQPLQIELPSNVYAFGFDLGELEPFGFDSTATLSNVVLSTGAVFAGPYSGNIFPTFAFFGFFSDLPIASLSMAPHALVEPILDNFTYAQAAIASPEPSSLLLLSSGLIGLVANVWRNRRRLHSS